MLNINKQVFSENLKLTQLYCHLQLKNNISDNAKILRSYNPTYGDNHLFTFVTERFDFEIVPNLKHCALAKWMIDPISKESIVENLFTEQINHKKKLLVQLKPTEPTQVEYLPQKLIVQ